MVNVPDAKASVPEGVDAVTVPSSATSGRVWNALLARVRTPYFLVLSDDCELPRGASVATLLEAVAHNRCEIAAGDVWQCRRKWWLFTEKEHQALHGSLVFAGDTLKIEAASPLDSTHWTPCDLAAPYFVARTNEVRSMGGWESDLPLAQREEFFVRAHRYGMRVGVSAGVAIWQWASASRSTHAAEVNERQRREEMSIAAAKMGVWQVTDTQGNTYEAMHRAQAA
jgi:hypothetical protein